MVTRRTGTLALLAALALGAALAAGGPRPARAQADTLYFVTVKGGFQEPSGDEQFDLLERDHGPLEGDRRVAPLGIELDMYSVRNRAGLALGIEVHRWEETFRFRDPAAVLPPEDVNLWGQGVLFTFKTFLRAGSFFPFVGAGLGNYYVKYRELSSGRFIQESVEHTARAGFRFLLGRLGLLAEPGVTHAPVELETVAGEPPATLELGGRYASAGLSWTF